MFRFLKFKKKVKKKMFLDEDFNMIDFPEYIDDYERTFLKMDFEETAKSGMKRIMQNRIRIFRLFLMI
jgi:hypothetical protein